MAEVLAEVRAGRFAGELREEESSSYARLENARRDNRETLIEETYERLRDAKS